MTEVCEHHESPLFRFRSATLIDGQIRHESFEFCRYCVGGQNVTCPNQECGYVSRIIDIPDPIRVLANVTVHELKCRKCGEVIAERSEPPNLAS